MPRLTSSGGRPRARGRSAAAVARRAIDDRRARPLDDPLAGGEELFGAAEGVERVELQLGRSETRTAQPVAAQRGERDRPRRDRGRLRRRPVATVGAERVERRVHEVTTARQPQPAGRDRRRAPDAGTGAGRSSAPVRVTRASAHRPSANHAAPSGATATSHADSLRRPGWVILPLTSMCPARRGLSPPNHNPPARSPTIDRAVKPSATVFAVPSGATRISRWHRKSAIHIAPSLARATSASENGLPQSSAFNGVNVASPAGVTRASLKETIVGAHTVPSGPVASENPGLSGASNGPSVVSVRRAVDAHDPVQPGVKPRLPVRPQGAAQQRPVDVDGAEDAVRVGMADDGGIAAAHRRPRATIGAGDELVDGPAEWRPRHVRGVRRGRERQQRDGQRERAPHLTTRSSTS